MEFNKTLNSLYRIVKHLFDSYCATKDPSELDVLIYQVTKVFRMMRASDRCSTKLLEDVGVGLSLLQDEQNSVEEGSGFGYKPQLLVSSLKGRPGLEISNDQLQYLLQLGFNCPQIAGVLGVSLSTVRR